MRIDYSLVRRILMNTADGKEGADARDFVCDQWDWDTVCKHIDLMREGGLVKASIQHGDGHYYYVHVNRLTWEGQQLMALLSNERAWDETLKKIRQIGGDASIDIVKALAAQAAMNIFGIL